MKLNTATLEQALEMLGGNMDLANTPGIGLVVCGGASLIATKVLSRATKDVDIVAFRTREGTLIAPVPLPEFLLRAAAVVARDLGLEPNWLNNGPSRDEGGLFQMGLPKGFTDRLMERVYGPRLTVYFIGRRDQIFFKVFSAADRGGVDLDDLAALRPTPDELEEAARWAMTIDVSEGYRTLLQDLLRNLDYESVAARI
jgi:hypothetical protein